MKRIHRPRKTAKTCARPGCGRFFHPWRKTQSCCSKSCARKHSPVFQAHLRSVARAGGKVGGGLRRQQAIARWNHAIGTMSKVEIAKAFYKKGYNNGRARQGRIDYCRGFDDGARAMRWAS